MFWNFKVLLILIALIDACVNLTLPRSDPPPPEEGRVDPEAVQQANLDTLILTQVLFRHGDRTPLTDYKTNPYHDYDKIYGVKGLGQLTPIGQKQAFNLGLYLRQRYNGYLSENYSFEEVFVQSSDFDRTISTALSCLQGLFYRNGFENVNDGRSEFEGQVDLANQRNFWKPIPVHVLAKSIDNIIGGTKPCKKYQQLLNDYLNSGVMQAMNQKNANLYEFLEKATGNNVTFYQDVYNIYDTLFINEIYNLVLPKWAKNRVFPEKMRPIADNEYTIYSATREMERLFVGPFLEEVITNMDVRIGVTSKLPDGRTPAKMYMYSGHDTTISPLLIALEVYDYDNPPPYTAMVALELHKMNPGNNKDYEIKLFYRPDQTNKTYELHPPKCGNPCTLKNFKIAYSSIWKATNGWDAECNSSTNNAYKGY